jgi:hypothetical protein
MGTTVAMANRPQADAAVSRNSGIAFADFKRAATTPDAGP